MFHLKIINFTSGNWRAAFAQLRKREENWTAAKWKAGNFWGFSTGSRFLCVKLNLEIFMQKYHHLS